MGLKVGRSIQLVNMMKFDLWEFGFGRDINISNCAICGAQINARKISAHCNSIPVLNQNVQFIYAGYVTNKNKTAGLNASRSLDSVLDFA